ncbi:MAG: cell wall-binding repeat-containing protein [Actinomycetes bacterium]
MSTTAAKRLRRAAIGGVAALATLGGTLALATGPAWASFGTTAPNGYVTTTSATVFPGQTGQTLNNVTVTLPDTWTSGDYVNLYITNGAPTSSGNTMPATVLACNTSANLNNYVGYATTPTVTAVNNANASSFTGFTATTMSSAACPQKDVIQLAMNAAPSTTSATPATNSTTFTLSGLSLNVGSNIGAGTTLNVDAVAATGTPFVSNIATAYAAQPLVPTASGNDYQPLATVGSSTVTVATPVGVLPSASGVTFPTTVVKEQVAGTVGTTLTLTLPTGDAFATAPTLTAPAGITVTAPTTALPANALTWTLSAPTTTPGTFTFTGGSVNFGTTLGVHTVAVTSAGGAGGTPNFAAVANTGRIGGIDRNATAASLFNSIFTSSTTSVSSAVLATGLDFPDALSANYLAKNLGTGVLLTDTNTLSTYAMTQLVNHNVATVYIVGGTGAVSQAVQNQIAAMHQGNNPANPLVNVIRLAGNTRYGTNSAVDLYPGMAASTAIVATGQNFPDALSVGPVVYKQDYPLVLTLGTSLSPEAATTLQSLGVRNVIVVGGTGAVSSAVTTAITNLGITVQGTLAGADRTQTAAAIANWEFATTGTTVTGTLAGLGWTLPTNVYVARGDIFPDALAAGPLAGKNAQPILLTDSPTTLGAGIMSFMPTLVGTTLSGGVYSTSLTGTSTTGGVTALGLTGAVSIATQTAAVAALAG